MKQKEAELDANFKNKTEQFTHESDGLKSRLFRLEQELMEKAAAINRLKEALNIHSESVKSMSNENVKLQNESLELTKKVDNFSELTITFQKEREVHEQAKKDLSAKQKSLHELEQELDKTKKNFQALEVNFTATNQKLIAKEASLHELKKKLAKNAKTIKSLEELLQGHLKNIESLEKQNLDLKNKDSAAQELIKQKNEYSATLETQLEAQRSLYQKSLDEQKEITKQLTAGEYKIKNLKQGSTKPPASKFRSFVLPIGLVLTALLGMGAGVAFSDAIKNLLAVLLKRA